MNPYNYILMTCKQAQIISDIDTNKFNIFAKILLNGEPGTRLFNTFVNTPQFLYTPITQLYKLDLAFYSPDGSLYDFNGVEHSFTLKVITVSDHPKGTGMNEIGNIS